MPFCVFYGGGLGLPDRSLDFSPSNSYLSMSDANFGSLDLTKFAVSAWVRGNSVGGIFLSQYKGSGEAFTLGFSSLKVRAVSYGSGGSNSFTGTNTLTSNVYHHILAHFDPANATPGDRLKVWLNGSLETDTDGTRNSTDINNVSEEIRIGGAIASDNSLSDNYQGYLYQLGIFSGRLPSIGEVYDSGPRDISNVPDLYSYIQTDTPNITDDYKISTDWTNTNSVVLSTTIPT